MLRICQVALDNAGPERRIGACREYYLISCYIRAEHRDDVEIIRVPYRGAASEGPRVAVVAPTAMPAQVAEIRRNTR
jgi:hypothetical protein